MKIGLIGGGGFAKEVAEIAELNEFQIAGYFSDDPSSSQWKYLGGLSEARNYKSDMTFAFCIGAVNSDGLARRAKIIKSLQDDGLTFETLISPKAVVSKGVKLGFGVIVAHSVVLSVDSEIGNFCILNTSAVIGHDAIVGHNSILAPLCFLGGKVQVMHNVLIGPHSSVLEGRTVGENSVIGCGAVVHRSVNSNSTVLPVVTKTV